MDPSGWLTGTLVYLAAAVLAVPLARLAGLGSIIGYLVAGILIGPWGLALAGDARATLHVAEFGVVLMLFAVGLELEPQRLWALRHAVFGWGSAQLVGSAALIAGVAVACGVDARLAIVGALGLAMSSTAIGLGTLAERNLLATTSGQAVLGVSLLQDVAAIPILAFVPLLAESEYRRELETDLEPFKGLLLGLFFIAVGMSIDFAVVAARPLALAAIVAGFLLAKAAVLWAMGRAMPIPLPERPVFILLLAQGGEFGFVVFQGAAQAGVIDAGVSSLLVAAVALSMLLTPLLLAAADRWWIPRLARGPRTPLAELDTPQDAPVIIAGFGRYGGIVGRLLYANGLRATVLDHDAEQVEAVRRFGWRVHYGDATRLDLLRTAGAARAKVFVLAIDDVAQSLAVAKLVREHFPQLTIVARVRNVSHYYAMRELGVEILERETLDSALMSARSVLALMGFTPHQARTLALRFRAHTIEQLELMRPHAGDERKLIALSKQGRQQLEALFAQERAAARRGGQPPR